MDCRYLDSIDADWCIYVDEALNFKCFLSMAADIKAVNIGVSIISDQWLCSVETPSVYTWCNIS